MMTQMRYALLVLAMIISLHYILTFSNENYGQATSFSNIKEKITGHKNVPPYQNPVPEEYYIQTNKTEPPSRKANAVFVMLGVPHRILLRRALLKYPRNSDLNGAVSSIKQMEDRFNKKFQYPYVFLNDQEFDEAFKSRVSKLTDAKVEFGVIPKDHWNQPDSIDEEKASAARETMSKNGVIYGGTAICVASTPAPDVKFFCDLDYDPFLIMQDQNKVYDFTSKNPGLVSPDNAMAFLSDDGGETYNRCHFWSNFEIADLDLWRGEAYNKFFDFLDAQGGFYYERWGDAPVHSIGAALFAKKEQIDIDMNLSNIVHKGHHMRGGSAGATSRRISITSGTLA
ncbi:hypothetical protein D9615_003967 [Tricholomella constricta]|uniref:Uncharacterized protein n=1 Tax=Tricholomella constricta TaxID=117010 RepID=A0A8H5M4Q0_9AGAR|nr:hypothetical protein D9615_003967 [Tricholomella constricta]